MDYSNFGKIDTFIFDVDGVFTNCEVIVMENGDLVRTMSLRDGQAVKFALERGYNIAIITKGWSLGVRKRFENLGIKHIYDNLTTKLDAFISFRESLNLSKETILYMGDDIPDLEIFPHVAISVCPRDGAIENFQRADYVTILDGGKGCVREVIEKVLRAQGKWVV